ncbi:hypothetical protein TNCT_49081 [Trichonephila clavata]|uniref:Uncharacterized protein n=1 Tax=Trichonephila clavata TaxID=2740835 RepID=A0A8X6L7T2_TRICU|nr:hypothetical protein TNCT_49081 [Trichonephila clavata]
MRALCTLGDGVIVKNYFLTISLRQNPFRVTPNDFRDANDNASVRSARDRLIGESGSARDPNHRTMNF